MDFIYLIRVLGKRKWIIFGAALFAGLIAWFLTRQEPNYYRSSTRISTGFAVPDEIKINEGFSVYDTEVKFNNATSTFTSIPVITLLSYELILNDLKGPQPFRVLTEKEAKSDVLKKISKQEAIKIFEDKLETMSILTSYDPKEKMLLEWLDIYGYSYKKLVKALSVYQVARTDYIQIDGISENPELSSYVVNTLFKQFIRYFRRIRSSKSQESVDTLQRIMEKKKQEFDEKNKILRGEGIVDATTENTSKFDLISDLEKTLTIEKNKQTDDYYNLRKLNQKLANLGDNSSGSTTTTQNDPNNNEELILARKAVNEAYSEYLKTNDKSLLSKYNQLKTEYNLKYANAKSGTTSTGIAKTNNRAELLEQKNDIEIDIEASNSKIKNVESKIALLKANVSSTSSRGANVETMMEDLKLAEKEYYDAKQKYNQAFDINSSSVNNFRQLQLAQPAIEPEPSKRMLTIGMATALTLLATILIIVLLTYLDTSIKTPQIFSKTVNLKLLSMVNFMDLKHTDLKDVITGNIKEEDVSEKKRSNVFRESIRNLRYEIENSGKKIFLFTSTKKSQGKTTLIQALGYSMSMSKKKILIIDTNFSNNDLTLQLDAQPVLEQISANGSNEKLISDIKHFSKDIGVGGVYVIGSEGGDYTPSEVLPRENILNHLRSLTSEYDYIFLEGPPLNDFSDSKELVQYVDGVIAIFSANNIIKQIDKESITFFNDLNGKFCGSVLNMVDLENINVA